HSELALRRLRCPIGSRSRRAGRMSAFAGIRVIAIKWISRTTTWAATKKAKFPMFSTLKRWFGQETGTHGQSRPARGDYRPELIPALQADHKELLALFAELERASERNDETACRTALDRFTHLLQDHLLTENRHLYGYFSRHPET